MLALMLNPRFKSFHLVSFFIVHDQGVAIWYNVIISYVHEMLLSLASINGFVDQKVDDGNSLEIFQKT
jgi:hypothetical protein